MVEQTELTCDHAWMPYEFREFEFSVSWPDGSGGVYGKMLKGLRLTQLLCSRCGRIDDCELKPAQARKH